MEYFKDICGIAIKNASIKTRLNISEICKNLEIPALNSISEPTADKLKHHPHIQFHTNLVDSFRGRHPRFVTETDFINELKQLSK